MHNEGNYKQCEKTALRMEENNSNSSNCSFLTFIHVFQGAGKVVWYSHLLKNVPQFVVIHTVKSFSVVNEAEVDNFLEFLCFFYDPIG